MTSLAVLQQVCRDAERLQAECLAATSLFAAHLVPLRQPAVQRQIQQAAQAVAEFDAAGRPAQVAVENVRAALSRWFGPGGGGVRERRPPGEGAPGAAPAPTPDAVVVPAEGFQAAPATDESLEAFTVDGLADMIAGRLRRRDCPTVAALAREYRPYLERLGNVRSWSMDATALRRFHEFLAQHVYGVRISDEDLPDRIREGRHTGGRRRSQHF